MISRRIQPPDSSAFLFGPRMTGKSTWLRHFCSDWLWIDLLQESNYQLYLAEPSRLRKEIEMQQSKIQLRVVIDEIQRVPSLLNEVQSLMEDKGVKFLLSGSSARKLKRGGANLLAGRAIALRLFPLTFLEIQNNSSDSKLNLFRLDDALQFGLLPKVFLSDEVEKKRILRTYVSTYLYEEIQAEGLVRNLPSFSRFLTLAAETVGQEVNYSDISRETTVKSKTIREYFSILEDTWLGYLLSPWQRSVRKQLAGSPKFYFFDNGVTNGLRESLGSGLSLESRGILFEQLIINEIRAELSYQEFEGSFYFWRARGGLEIDLLIARGTKPILAIEIKHTANPGARHLAGLKSIEEEYPKLDQILICSVPRSYVQDGIRVYNYQQFLKDLGNGKIF